MPNDVFESVDAHGKYKVSNFKNVLIFIFCKGYPHRIILKSSFSDSKQLFRRHWSAFVSLQ